MKIKSLVLATHNRGKIKEFSSLLSPYVEEFPSSADLGLEEPEETGKTFAENAVLKAMHAAKSSGMPALADDSGLCVHALDDAPGVLSARWAGPDKDFSIAMRKINDLLADNEDRSAAFVCALALCWPDGRAEVFEGRIDGAVCWPPRGEKGFGYDPFFIPEGETRTFSEMSGEEKSSMSHRAKAFERLVKSVFESSSSYR